MLDLALVTRALEGPGIEVADRVVDETMQLARSAEITAAADRAATALRAGSTDIRVIVPYLLGVFAEGGPASLPAILVTLAAALKDRWDVLRPAERRARVADSALSLMFRSIKASIDYHESVRDPTWRAWARAVTRALPEACASEIAALDAAIARVIDAPRSAAELAGLRTRTEDYFNVVPPPAPASEASAATGGDPPAADAAPVATESAMAPGSGASGGSAAAPGEGLAELDARPVLIEASPALQLFLRKLAAFQRLVEQGDMARAAIVALDVRKIVEAFDPRVYLPKLLTPHFRLLSAHIDEIAPRWDEADGAAWQALEQLYHVDLDAFIEP